VGSSFNTEIVPSDVCGILVIRHSGALTASARLTEAEVLEIDVGVSRVRVADNTSASYSLERTTGRITKDRACVDTKTFAVPDVIGDSMSRIKSFGSSFHTTTLTGAITELIKPCVVGVYDTISVGDSTVRLASDIGVVPPPTGLGALRVAVVSIVITGFHSSTLATGALVDSVPDIVVGSVVGLLIKANDGVFRVSDRD